MNDKKKIEASVLNQFRKQYQGFPTGSLKPSESPDFILDITPRLKIGIELTHLHPHKTGAEVLSYENLCSCLETKNEKLPLYRKKKLNEYWLIIYLTDLLSWKKTNINNKLIIWEFNTGFNRVFLFNTIIGKIFELNQ